MRTHQGLTLERWWSFTLLFQLANVGADVGRAIKWKKQGHLKDSASAFERALDLLEATIADPKNRTRLKELTRAREMLLDFFIFDNEYHSTDESWDKYFNQFGYAAAIERGR
jgi:hypothetical protein